MAVRAGATAQLLAEAVVNPTAPSVSPNQAPWWPFVLGELGVKERAGDADNPRILEYLRTTTLPESMIEDETAWCSAAANWCMKQAGIPGTGKANARSWLEWGSMMIEPVYGCIVVLWRESPQSKLGHVGFYVGHSATSIYLAGGNQNNEFSIAPYPKARVLAFRWPKG